MKYAPILVLGCLFVLNACSTPNKKIINDSVTEREVYLSARFELIKGEKDVPEWLHQEGVSAPVESVIIHGESYVFGEICKQHDCANNRFLVIFKPDKTPLAGLLVTVKDTPEATNPQEHASFRRFGTGKPEIQRYLLNKVIQSWKDS